MSKITVHLAVTIDGHATGNGDFPAALSWDYTLGVCDNPRYYGDGLRRAIDAAATQARAGAAVYVDLAEEGSPR